MTRTTNRNLLGLGLMATLLQGCWWTAPQNDAGLDAWVAHAIPVVLGRKAKNGAEIRALADLAQHNGKAAVVRALATQPEYATYWSQVMADALDTQRTGNQAAFSSCWDEALIDDPAVLAGLSKHIMRYGASVEYCENPQIAVEHPHDYQLEHDDRGEPIDDGGRGEPVERDAERESEEGGERGEGAAGDAAGSWPEGGNSEPEISDEWVDPAGPFGVSDAPMYERPLDVDTSEPEYAVERDLGAEEEAAAERRSWLSTDPGQCWSFTMNDVLRSAIVNDDLAAIYVANLVPVSTFLRTLDGNNETSARQEAASLMMTSYTKRDDGCMGCHSSTFSTTDARESNGQWDRFWGPLQASQVLHGSQVPQLDLEGSAFSYMEGSNYRYRGNGSIFSRVRNTFRTDIHAPSASGSFSPWGMDANCSTDPGNNFLGFRYGVPSDPNSPAAMATLQQSTSRDVLDLARDLAVGAQAITDPAAQLVPVHDPNYDGGDANAGYTTFSGCLGCHNGVTGPDLDGIVDRINPAKLHLALTSEKPDAMANGSWDRDDVEDILAYLANPWDANHSQYSRADVDMRRHAHPREGFAHMVALNLVNNIVKEVQGYELTLDHGFARNLEQSAALDELADVLIDGGWSLEDVLVEIVTAEAFGRKAPEDTTGMTYEMPMIANPWSAAPPGTPPAPHLDSNGQGDLVHRYSVPNLLMSLNSALGWPASRIHGGTAAYPEMDDATKIGRYRQRDAQEAVDVVDLPRFLSWEEHFASCDKPSHVRVEDVDAIGSHPAGTVLSPTQWNDWIDHLVATADPTLTYEQFFGIIRDRMFGDPTFDTTTIGGKTELEWAADAAGVDETVTIDFSDLDTEARAVCSVMLRSPQFMLSGIPIVTGTPAVAAQAVCTGPDCTYNEFCDKWEPLVQGHGGSRNCDGSWVPVDVAHDDHRYAEFEDGP
jgi:cytochrome c2